MNSRRKVKNNVGMTNTNSSASRLKKELKEIMLSCDKTITAFPDEDNTFKWNGKIKGPVDSAYEGLAYRLSITFPENYPYQAPTIKFLTPCFHPNVDAAGNICLDTLKEHWSSCNSVLSVLLSIQSLLQDPNVDSPLNTQAASLWSKQNEYKKTLILNSTEALELFKEWR